MDYNKKYLKYKEKYLKLKNQIGGVGLELSEIPEEYRKSEPSRGDILVDVNGFTAVFTGESRVDYGSSRRKYIHDKGFAYADNNRSKWIAVSNADYESLIKKKEKEFDSQAFPPVPSNCTITSYNIYDIQSRHYERNELPVKYRDISEYDRNYSFCVIAKDEQEARQLCNSNISGESEYSPTFWIEPKWSICKLIGKSCIDESQIICKSYA